MNYRDFVTKLLLFGTVLFCARVNARVPEKARQLLKKKRFNRARDI